MMEHLEEKRVSKMVISVIIGPDNPKKKSSFSISIIVFHLPGVQRLGDGSPGGISDRTADMADRVMLTGCPE